MSDSEIIPGGPPPTPPNSFGAFAATDKAHPGTPVYVSAANKVESAQANAAATALVVGLTLSNAKADERLFVRYAGPLTLTDAEIAAISGDEELLQPGKVYYVSAAAAGKITKTAPGGANIVSPIGVALDANTLNIGVQLSQAA